MTKIANEESIPKLYIYSIAISSRSTTPGLNFEKLAHETKVNDALAFNPVFTGRLSKPQLYSSACINFSPDH